MLTVCWCFYLHAILSPHITVQLRNGLIYQSRCLSTDGIILYMKILLLHLWHTDHGVPVVVMIALGQEREKKHFLKVAQFLSIKKHRTWAIIFKWGNNDFFWPKRYRKPILYYNFKIFCSICISYLDLEILLGKHLKEIRDIHNDMHTEMPFIALF